MPTTTTPDDEVQCPECKRWVRSLDQRAGHRISCDMPYSSSSDDDEYDEF